MKGRKAMPYKFIRGGIVTMLLAGLLAVACSSSKPASTVVQVSHDQFAAHAEPAVATNPADPKNVLAASMVLQSPARGIATYVSVDGGHTWRSNGLLPESGLRYDADVTIAFDTSGHGFVCAWVGDRADESNGGVRVWRTDNGGRTFRQPVRAVPGFMDHPGLAADPSPRSQDLYLAGTFTYADGLKFTRSTNGGQRFERARGIDREGRLPVIAAGPDGLVAVMYFVFQPNGAPTAFIVTSTDHGATFNPPRTLGAVQTPSRTTSVNARSGPALAIDPNRGTIYAAIPAPGPVGSHIALYTSADRGRSWRLQTTTPSLRERETYAQPQLAANSRGQVGLFTFQITKDNVRPLLFVVDPGGRTLGIARPLQPSGFDPTAGKAPGSDQDTSPTNQAAWIGDYQAMSAAGAQFHPLWNATVNNKLQLVTTQQPAALG